MGYLGGLRGSNLAKRDHLSLILNVFFSFGSGFLKLLRDRLYLFFIFLRGGEWDCIVGRNAKRLPPKLKFLLDLYSFRYQYFFVRITAEGLRYFLWMSVLWMSVSCG